MSSNASSWEPFAKTNDSEKDFKRLDNFLKLLNLLELKQELEQPISPITGLSDLCQKTDATLQVLEVAFAKVSDSCSHWTINSLFGSNAIATYLEKLVHRANQKIDRFQPQETTEQRKIREFSHSLLAEITVSLSLNYFNILAGINPMLIGVGIISTALGETLIQYALNIVSVQSFSIFTQLIRQRLTEYSEFKDFMPEYKLYTNFFRVHDYKPTYNLQISERQDNLKVFKLIDSFSEINNRGTLLHQLIIILEKDEVFQARLKQKFSQLGVIFWKLSSILADNQFLETQKN